MAKTPSASSEIGGVGGGTVVVGASGLVLLVIGIEESDVPVIVVVVDERAFVTMGKGSVVVVTEMVVVVDGSSLSVVGGPTLGVEGVGASEVVTGNVVEVVTGELVVLVVDDGFVVGTRVLGVVVVVLVDSDRVLEVVLSHRQ